MTRHGCRDLGQCRQTCYLPTSPRARRRTVSDQNSWTLEQARKALSEVVRRAIDHRPQTLVRGPREEDAVVVVARSDYERLLASHHLAGFLRESPLAKAVAAQAERVGDVDPFARPRDLGRDLDL